MKWYVLNLVLLGVAIVLSIFSEHLALLLPVVIYFPPGLAFTAIVVHFIGYFSGPLHHVPDEGDETYEVGLMNFLDALCYGIIFVGGSVPTGNILLQTEILSDYPILTHVSTVLLLAAFALLFFLLKNNRNWAEGQSAVESTRCSENI